MRRVTTGPGADEYRALSRACCISEDGGCPNEAIIGAVLDAESPFRIAPDRRLRLLAMWEALIASVEPTASNILPMMRYRADELRDPSGEGAP